MKSFWEEDFIGGTLVEYEWGYDWYSKKEFDRGVITKCKLDKKRKSAMILTDGKAKFMAPVNVDNYRDGIWFLGSSPYFNVMYRVAPKGVNVGGLV